MESNVSTALITVYRTPCKAYGEGDLSGGRYCYCRGALVRGGEGRPWGLWQPAASWAPGSVSCCFGILKEVTSFVNLMQYAKIIKIPKLL